MIDFTPNPIALQLGPFTVFWYGIGYAVGLLVAYLVMSGEARRRGHDPELLANGIIVVAIAALIGGRAYHVIDQWQNLYASDPIKVFLPPYEGLGVYGGLITGTLAAYFYARRRRVSFWTWTDIVAPACSRCRRSRGGATSSTRSSTGRRRTCRGGSRSNATAASPSTPAPPVRPRRRRSASTSSRCSSMNRCPVCRLIVLLILARRYPTRLRTGQLLGFFFVWYGIVRFALETLRADNWTFFGIPTAQIFSSLFILFGLALILVRRSRGAPTLAAVDAEARAAHDVPALAIETGSARPRRQRRRPMPNPTSPMSSPHRRPSSIRVRRRERP